METIILGLICSRNCQLDWWRIDRALTARGHGPSQNLISLLRNMEEKGLIKSVKDENLIHPVYSITEAGRALVKNKLEG